MLFSRLIAFSGVRQQLLVVLLVGLAVTRVNGAAQTAAARPASLVTVQLAREGDVSIVTLEADGPLPEPTFGVAHDPFRFYVDFPNVAPESRGVLNSADPLVVRVRVATYSIDPLVSRVVLDLKREMPIRVDTDGRGAGRIRILVGMNKSTTAAKSAPPPKTTLPPVPSLPPASAPVPVTTQTQPVQAPPVQTPTVQTPPPPKPQVPGPSPQPTPPPQTTAPPPATTPPPTTTPPKQAPPVAPTSSPATKTPAQTTPPAPGGTSGTPPPPPPGFNPLPTPSEASKAAPRVDDRYRTQIAGPLDQLRALRPLLASIDVLKTEDVPGIPAAIERAESIRQALAAVKPTPDRGPTHDMLLQSCTLAQRALKLRMSGTDPTSLRNAGSAAAGALLLLDRVCIDVGCEAPPKR